MDFYIDDDELKSYFLDIEFIFNNINLIREHLDIIFVFGSAPSETSGRTLFMNYIEEEKTPFQFVTIERLYNDLRTFAFKSKGASSEKIKLAELEYIAIKNAFSILIFPESPGSYAELGYFSAKEDTRKKIIVSNKLKYHSKRTYVNSVIDFIHEDKEMKPVIYTDEENKQYFSNYIKDLLENYIDYEKEVFIKLKNKKNNNMYTLGIVYELIKLFPSLIYSELLSLVKYSFDKLSIDVKEVDNYLKAMISLLVISNLINRVELSNGAKVFQIVNDKYSCFKFKNTEEEHIKILMHIRAINERKTL